MTNPAKETEEAAMAKAPGDDLVAPSTEEIRSAMKPDADPEVRNRALRRLFLTDPHFRQSDGLDVGLEEAFEVQQSLVGRQRKILLARSLGLLDDELLPQEPPERD